MTIIVQFENNNGYAEGVAIMSPALFEHPLMGWALESLAMEMGFDFVSSLERETPYEHFHYLADTGI